MPRKGDKQQRVPLGDVHDPYGWHRLTEAFFEWMGVTNYSQRTIDNRRTYLGYFVVWCLDRGITRPCEVSRATIERYQRHLFHYRKKNGAALSTRSQHSRLVPVRALFKWLTRQNHILHNPASEIDLPKLEHRLPKAVLSIAEAEAVMAQPDVSESAADPLGLRDRAMLETLYSTGMRRMELATLQVHDLDTDRGTIIIRQGKGRKDRMVPIGARAVHWISRYLDDLRPELVREPDCGTLFLTKLFEPFTPNRLTQLVRNYIDAADIGKRGSCHLLRHTCATLMLENGADIRFIQQLLGHAKLETTQIYTQVSIRKLKEIHAATHPARIQRTPDPDPGPADPESSPEVCPDPANDPSEPAPEPSPSASDLPKRDANRDR